MGVRRLLSKGGQHFSKTNEKDTIFLKKVHTGEPRFPWSFYLRIRLFTFEIWIKRTKFLVELCLFICEFSIRGPK
jgi:hypothetical protein